MMLRPDAVVSTVTAVTPDFLRARGVHAVMVDLDDTLLASGSEVLDPSFRAWLSTLQDAGIPVVILSNGERSRVARWAEELRIGGLALIGKPFRRAFRKGLEHLGSPPQQTSMVGDQLFTDILGANRAGMVSVLVRPLSPGGLPHTRLLRRLEQRLLEVFKLQEGSTWPSSR
jgi:HAD superfamily phosphatase (TIGR01668 family)